MPNIFLYIIKQSLDLTVGVGHVGLLIEAKLEEDNIET
jgi:hypothetical protein